MAIELVTQEKMDLSSVKQDASMLGHRNFVELFEDENVAEQRKHNIAWHVAHFVTLNGITKNDLQAMLKFIMEEFFYQEPEKPILTVIKGKEE